MKITYDCLGHAYDFSNINFFERLKGGNINYDPIAMYMADNKIFPWMIPFPQEILYRYINFIFQCMVENSNNNSINNLVNLLSFFR